MACGDYQPGKMKHKVSLQQVSQVTDSQGGYTESWATIATLWASIEPAKGYEKYQAMRIDTPVSHKVMLRYNSAVTTAKRLLYGSRVFEIKECINVDEANAFLRLMCVEITTS